MIDNARWADAEHSAILATIDGQTVCIPVAPGNRHYDEIVHLKITIAEFEA